MAFPDGPGRNVRITGRAERDLAALLRKDRRNFTRVWNDIRRYAEGKLPQAPKALKGFRPPLWQVDSGDFRIFHTWEESVLWIRGVLRKPEQARRIRGMR